MNIIIFLVLTFTISYITGLLFDKFGLPKLLAYLIVGLIIGNFFYFDEIMTDQIIKFITSFALSIILLKAGLGIEKVIIKKVGIRVLILGILPNIIEAILISLISYYFLDFGIYVALMFGFIISAVSPAVVIPSMTKLIDTGYEKEIPTLNLTSSGFSSLVSLTMFSIFLSLYLGNGDGVTVALLAPLKVVLGGAIGGMIGYILGKSLKVTRLKRYQVLQASLVLIISILLMFYGEHLFIIEMIALMSLGYFLNSTNQDVSKHIKFYTNQVWICAQVFLFFTIGFLTDLTLISEYFIIGIVIIFIGLLGKTVGVILSLHRSDYNYNQRLFSVLGNVPKGTVQAALGAVPLSYGIANGDIILSLSALAIILTAPIGLILIEIYSIKLLKKEPIEAT